MTGGARSALLATLALAASSAAGRVTRRQCTDVVNWAGSDGEGCRVYEQYSYCDSDGSAGTGWLAGWGTLASYQTNGVDATMACCVCGGGSSVSIGKVPRPAPTTSMPPRSQRQRPIPPRSSSSSRQLRAWPASGWHPRSETPQPAQLVLARCSRPCLRRPKTQQG